MPPDSSGGICRSTGTIFGVAIDPASLPVGTLLADRFELERVLGRGAFGIVYLAHDMLRNEPVVVKELAPIGTRRMPSGVLDLQSDDGQRLRQSFLSEAKTIGKLLIHGVPSVRSSFVENGTAYFVTDYLPNSKTLEQVMAEEGPLAEEPMLDILYQCLEILESIHAKGILHRDIKPSNILINQRGDVMLIDFGAAREWHADRSLTHTVLLTPNYAPLEQMTESARRGPATDLFALSATAYEMLTGRKPESATDRASGSSLTPILKLCPHADGGVARAIEAGLNLRFQDRPQSATDYRALLAEPLTELPAQTLTDLDGQAFRLQDFKFDKGSCPSCKNLLIEPKPLKAGLCPVCREAPIKERVIVKHRCPICRLVPLKRRRNLNPMFTCPACKTGVLEHRTKGILNREIQSTCQDCGALFVGDKVSANGKSWETLLADSGRSEFLWHCEECGGQFDEETDGRFAVKISGKTLGYDRLYSDEWDYVAAGVAPGAGNGECPSCGADFFTDNLSITLLGYGEDRYGFGIDHVGRLLDREEVRWLAVSKTSPHPGPVCPNCKTEFDRTGGTLTLVRSSDRKLNRYSEESLSISDWHRVGQNLPTAAEEDAFFATISDSLKEAFRSGQIGFDSDNEVSWKGPATNAESGSDGTLTINRSEVRFGGMLRKIRLPLDEMTEIHVENATVTFMNSDGASLRLNIQPIELSAQLRSGVYVTELTAEDLAARLGDTELERVAMP